MAKTEFSVNSPEAKKLWSAALFHDTLKKTWFNQFVGTGSDSIIQKKEDFKKGGGDRLTVTLRMLLQGDGVLGDATLEGNEEALRTYTDNLFIDQQRHAVRVAGKMTEQRVPWDIRKEARDGLSDWFAERFDAAMFNQLSGYTPVNNLGGPSALLYGGNNIILPASTARIIRPNSKTTDESLTTGDEFNLSLIDRAVARAKKSTPLIRPVKINGKDKWVMVLHTDQVTQMRTNTSAGQWLDIQNAAQAGGKISDNPIYTGALGEYNGVILHESTRATNGVNSTTGARVADVRRAVLLGAQAGIIGYGKGSDQGSIDWNEELFDYGNQLGVAAGSIFGIKKTQFTIDGTATDFGTIVVSTYSPDV